MSSDKELVYCCFSRPLLTQLIEHIVALQALFDCLCMCWLGSGLKSEFPILLNWVRLRPGIWDGAISSTEGVAFERVST